MEKYDANDISKVFNGFGNTYAKIVDYSNTYFSGEETKFDYDRVCTTSGINISPIINLFAKFIVRHKTPETFIDEMEKSLNDPNSEFNKDYEILIYYINMAHRLEQDLWLSLESIRISDLVHKIADKKNIDITNEDNIVELVRIGIQTLDSLRDLMYTTINYSFIIHLSGLMKEGRSSSLKKLSDSNFFYKEIKPVLTSIFSYTGTLIIESPLMYYDNEMQIGVKMKRYTIFFGNSSHLATIAAITYIEDSGGHPVNDFQIVSIDDVSYFRTTIGHIIPDYFRSVMGMGHAKYILDKSKIRPYLKSIISKVCDSDEEVEMLIDTFYSFDTFNKKNIFGEYIKKYQNRIEFSVNELNSIRVLNGENVMEEEIGCLPSILNRPEVVEEFIKPLEDIE